MSFAPQVRRSLPRVLTVLGILAICTGASTSSSCSFRDRIGDDGTDGDNPDFATHLEIQDASGQITDTFERGELIQMVLTVRNRRNEAVRVEFPTTQTFDFVVVRENSNDVLWQLSDSAGAAPPATVATTIDFAPNQTQTFTTTWNQVDNDGNDVRTGAYEARGVLVYDGFDSNPLRSNQLGSTLERFTIN